MNIGIYKITNPEGEIYIGKSVNINKRLTHYKSKNGKGQPLLEQSILKYGWDNHQFEILQECKKSNINNREKYWIEFYNSLNNGLNCNKGGGGVINHSKKTKIKISKANKGNPSCNKGKQLSKEHKNNIGKSNKGKIRSQKFKNNLSKIKQKKVLQFSKKGILLNKFDSYIEAKQITKIESQFNLIGKTKTAGGFIWIYEEDWNGLKPVLKPNGNLGKPKPWLKGRISPKSKYK